MALYIGFTSKFYTLWDVTSEIHYYTNQRGEHHAGYEKVTYHYIQNLSTDLTKAQLKASEMGCKDLTPDDELYGRNRSFEYTKKLFCELTGKLSPFFMFGKYDTKLISECTDLNYLFWYYNKSENRYAKNILIASGQYNVIDDAMYTIERYNELVQSSLEKGKFNEFIKNSKESGFTLRIDFERNLNRDGFYSATLKDYGINTTIDVKFNEFKVMYYNGFEYGLPVINGKAKKVKGLSIVVLCKVVYNEYYERFEAQVVEIKNIINQKLNQAA